MPTNRALWKNLETPKQNMLLEKLSANFRRPAPTASPDRLDATPVRHAAPRVWAQHLMNTHKIILVEHDYAKTGDVAGTSRFSTRITLGGTGVTINYDGTNSISINSQNSVVPVTVASEYAPGSYTAVASVGGNDHAGRRKVIYPRPVITMIGDMETVLPTIPKDLT